MPPTNESLQNGTSILLNLTSTAFTTTTWKRNSIFNSSLSTHLPALDELSTQHIPIRNECYPEKEELHSSFFGVTLALPEWEAIITAIVLSIIIVLTIIGNILVILSVFTYKPLRIVQNFFIVSLAVADLTVALLVLPFNVAYSILGRWEFGIHLCKMWLTCDVMCCTSSILNLCAIALDRYWAITDPINYAHKRTVGRVLLLISGVWILSLLISSPPLVGWNDWPEEFTSATPCELTSNRGYVIYSSLGSFFIPLIIMTIVYIEIFIATRRRLRERTLASKMHTITSRTNDPELTDDNIVEHEKTTTCASCATIMCCGKNPVQFRTSIVQNDQESFSSETRPNSDTINKPLKHKGSTVAQRKQHKRLKVKDSIKRAHKHTSGICQPQTGGSHDETELGMERLLPASNDSSKSADAKDISLESSGGCQKDETSRCPTTDDAYAIKSSDDECDSRTVPTQAHAIGASTTVTVTLEKKSTGVYQFIEERQKISLSKERRAARTLGIIMGVFVICWMPFFLMYVILPFCDTCCPTQKFKNFITWMGYINSGLNPVIYTIFNLDYRRAFKRLLGLNSN